MDSNFSDPSIWTELDFALFLFDSDATLETFSLFSSAISSATMELA